MGIIERREREQEELRQKILDAASELFAKEGYTNVSMRKIAEKIEYSPTTIYLHFKDKADLLNDICEATFANLIRILEKLDHGQNNPIECLRQGMRAYIDFGLEFPNHYEITFITPLTNYLSFEEHSFEGSGGQKAFEYIVRHVIGSMEVGQLRKADVATVSQTIWTMIHGVTSLLITHTDFPFVDKEILIESVLDTTLSGLKS